jgi:polyhydroxyalkanoate synthase subunit PhaC
VPDINTRRVPVSQRDLRSPQGVHLTTPTDLDRGLHAWQNRFTGGRSPSTVALACLDWAAHAANAPFQTAELGRMAMAQWARLMRMAMGVEALVKPEPDDHRFATRPGASAPTIC